MKTMTVTIDLENAAWHNEDESLNRFALKDALNKATHVITEARSHITDDEITYTICDVNGNACGKAVLTFKE